MAKNGYPTKVLGSVGNVSSRLFVIRDLRTQSGVGLIFLLFYPSDAHHALA